MRTVHEPEAPKASATNANPIDPTTGQPRKGPKIRLTANGTKSSSMSPAEMAKHADKNPDNMGKSPSDPDYDPSPPNDNIQYIPAHHPITGQPGFMITYPPDINFTQFESEIPADQLMRLLRRQLHWAQQESEDLKAEIEALESLRREEWVKKEVLLEGAMSGEFAHGTRQGLLADVRTQVQAQMEGDLDCAKGLKWTQSPWWKGEGAEGWRFGVPRVQTSAAGGGRKRTGKDGDDVDVDDELQRRERTADDMLEVSSAAGKKPAPSHTEDDDMMAVGALMGLSGVNTDS